MARFKTNPWDLSELLALLDSRRVVLPEFQRSFVWWPKDIDLLITSLVQDFPAGSLLFLRADPANPLAWRAVEGVEEASETLPDYLVLDGQQRLTSLSLALSGRGDHLFFMDLEALEQGDIDNGIYYLRREKARNKGLLERDRQHELHQYPLGAVFGKAPGDEDWFEDYVFFHHERGEADLQQLRERTRSLKRTYVDPLRQYRFPVVELPADTSLEAVCQIFETLNKTGMKLTVFDLLTAKFWPRGLHLRDMFEQARSRWSLLGSQGYAVDATYLLQAISLLRTEDAPRCKRGDLLQLEAEGFEHDWEKVCAGSAAALRMLRDDCGVLDTTWLPYASLYPALFAVATRIGELSGPAQGAAWDKLRRWFWCSSFGQRYEGPPNTLNAADLRQLLAWIGDDAEVPEAVADFAIESLDLRAAKRQRSALYRSVICLTIANGARDFHTGRRITAELLHDPELRIEDHHVVPSGYLKALDDNVDREDSVLNRCLIDAVTNNVIRARPPREYLAEVAGKIGEDGLDAVLTSHFLPAGLTSSLRREPLELQSFLVEREKLLLPAIAAVTGAEITEEQVHEAYLHPERPFTNDLALRRLLRGLTGKVFWYEQHMDRKVLELLIDELPRESLSSVRLLSGPANLSPKTQRAFERFTEEMAAEDIECEWRVVPAERAREIHARALFDDASAYELPPLNSILKGTIDSIRASNIPREPFDTAWTAEDAVPLQQFERAVS